MVDLAIRPPNKQKFVFERRFNKESHPDAIKRDLAPHGFTVLQFHQTGNGAHDHEGVAIVARD